MRASTLTWVLLVQMVFFACNKDPERSKGPAKSSPTAAPTLAVSAVRTVELPLSPSASSALSPPPEPPKHCPRDMVLVANRYCVDRYETSLVDPVTGESFSPYFPILSNYDEFLEARQKEALSLMNNEAGTAPTVNMPELPAFQVAGNKTKPKAVSRPDVIPSGHLTMTVAKSACESAGKRLCSLEEWQTACRGEAAQKFPYGPDYQPRQCNVFREDHPGRILFGNFSVGMQDPRMGTLETEKGPLLRRTGQTKTCASTWGKDAIYDMVGNLDEWIDDPDGTFVGGFFSRATKEGCSTIVTAHAGNYRDYSLGTRCCSDAK